MNSKDLLQFCTFSREPINDNNLYSCKSCKNNIFTTISNLTQTRNFWIKCYFCKRTDGLLYSSTNLAPFRIVKHITI